MSDASRSNGSHEFRLEGSPTLGVDPTHVDRPRAIAAATELLEALGADLERGSLVQTPERMVDSYIEQLTPQPFHATTFPNDGGYDELVVARDITFHSLCEHHLLPFVGVAHVAYLPGDRKIGRASCRERLQIPGV